MMFVITEKTWAYLVFGFCIPVGIVGEIAIFSTDVFSAYYMVGATMIIFSLSLIIGFSTNSFFSRQTQDQLNIMKRNISEIKYELKLLRSTKKK